MSVGSDFCGDSRRGRHLALRIAKKRFAKWRDRFDDHVVKANAAHDFYENLYKRTGEEFAATRAAYEEAMALQAPVKYWQDKAASHKAAEFWSMIRVLAFFPIAVLTLGGMFGFASWYLLNNPHQNTPAALYFVVSGGLASVAGVLFWAGRLLTKLYLSEHHLRHDAEERAVMTTTYLALTHEKAAEQTDRTIILAALFRNTPDGIVKDDGAIDASLGALLGKILNTK